MNGETSDVERELRALRLQVSSLSDKLDSLVLLKSQSVPSPLHQSPGLAPAFSPPSEPSHLTLQRQRVSSSSGDLDGKRERDRFAAWAASQSPGRVGSPVEAPAANKKPPLYPSRVVLTTYPGQVGVEPIPLIWGASDPQTRGPVVASRLPSSIKARNAVGAYGGGYSIYRSLAVAVGALNPAYRPDYTNTEPPVNLPPQPSWFDPHKIVSIDPWGHLAPTLFKAHYERGIDVRPTIAVTKAHLKVLELDDAVRRGRLTVDGEIVVKAPPMPHGMEGVDDVGVEVNVSKAAIEPVWFLPGIAQRFEVEEATLRRALFEETGGMFPELLTRNDLKVFLPPIGGATVYIFGPPRYLSDESKKLTLRVHDECNGSDVFGSDICTCRPYLLYGIEEAIRAAQDGGVGVVVYFRKEGRALGEVTKYLVYNARKRSGDSAAKYFASTELVAGLKDMRFQKFMPDTLHFLGIKKIDHMISMSDMKYDAIVESGIPILERHDLPDEMMPSDSRVEIQAKIASGYYSSTGPVAEADLVHTIGRAWDPTPASWEDVLH